MMNKKNGRRLLPPLPGKNQMNQKLPNLKENNPINQKKDDHFSNENILINSDKETINDENAKNDEEKEDYNLFFIRNFATRINESDQNLYIIHNKKQALIFNSKESLQMPSNIDELMSSDIDELIQEYKYDKSKYNKIHINFEEIIEKIKNETVFYSDSPLAPNNEIEMKRIYQEVQRKHLLIKNNSNNIQRYTLSNSYCKSTGWFGFLGKCKVKNEFENLAIGVNIYFNFLKLLMCIFLLMALISIFLIEGYSSCHSERKINNLLDLLYKTTIGNIESSSFTCQSFEIDILKNENFTFNFDCQSLNISSISSFSVSKSKDIEIKN